MALHKELTMVGPFDAIRLALASVVLPWAMSAAAQAEGIFTCVDKAGRSYLSDKLIPECMDVVQTEYGKSGIVKRRIEPETNLASTITRGDTTAGLDAGKERALREARQQKALLDRYPNETSHTQERKRALLTVDESIKSINTQTNQHLLQRQALMQEQAGFKVKQAPVPPELQQKLNETDALLALLNRQLSERMYERQRINQRFDSEINQLRQLWARVGTATTKTN